MGGRSARIANLLAVIRAYTTSRLQDFVVLLVKVRRPNVRVLASRYASLHALKVALAPEEQMRQAIARGASLDQLPVQIAATVVPANDTSPTRIHLSIDVSAEVSGPISGILGVIGPDRLLKTSRHALARSGDGKTYVLELLVPATAGSYEFRFAVADESGAVGAATRTIVVKAP